MTIPAPTINHDHAYGIVNPYGELWTWNTFEKAEEAEQHLRDFWGKDADGMAPKFSLCAVRVEIIPESDPFPLPSAQVDRSPEGQDAEERLDRNDESAVPKECAQKGSA